MKFTAPLLFSLAGLFGSALAHDIPLNSKEIAPRIGQISDEVARQRLTAAGLQRPEIAERSSERIVARALHNGQLLTLHIHPLTGAITDERDPTRKMVNFSGVAIKPIAATSSQPVREHIADKALMDGHAK
jgi:hypothetical protein